MYKLILITFHCRSTTVYLPLSLYRCLWSLFLPPVFHSFVHSLLIHSFLLTALPPSLHLFSFYITLSCTPAPCLVSLPHLMKFQFFTGIPIRKSMFYLRCARVQYVYLWVLFIFFFHTIMYVSAFKPVGNNPLLLAADTTECSLRHAETQVPTQSHRHSHLHVFSIPPPP